MLLTLTVGLLLFFTRSAKPTGSTEGLLDQHRMEDALRVHPQEVVALAHIEVITSGGSPAARKASM